MQCKCGNELKYITHTVKTDQGKAKWIKTPVKGDLEVSQWDCPGCGRHRREISCNDKIIERFG